MVCCIVWGCKNRSQTVNGTVGYHSFPQKNPALLQKWLDALNLTGDILTKHCRVCSVHFTPQDYKRDFRHELIGTKKKRVLRDNAIPSLNGFSQHCKKEFTSWSAETAGTLKKAVPITERASTSIRPNSGSMEVDHFNGEKNALDPLGERSTNDPLSDPLAEDAVEIIPEFEVKEEPCDYYEDNITDAGSPYWISDGMTLVGENDVDIELDDVVQLENNIDDHEAYEKLNNIHDETMQDVVPLQKSPGVGGRHKQRYLKHSRRLPKNFVPYEVDFEDELDDGLLVTMENVLPYRDDFGWRQKRQTEADLLKRRRELENCLLQCRANVKVMQSRLDEERGKMLRLQHSLINVRRRLKQHELKKMHFRNHGNDIVEEPKDSFKANRINIERKNLASINCEKEKEDKKNYEEIRQVRLKMARLREMKVRKALEQKNAGVVDYQKDLENKLRMARLREIKAHKALERKLNSDKMSPEAKTKLKLKPLKIPKPEEFENGEDYEKLLENKLRAARMREIKAMKALEKLNSEEKGNNEVVEKVDEMKLKKKVKRLKIKMKPPKIDDEEKAQEMKVKMAKLREIKAQKALERKRLEDLGMLPVKDKIQKKKGQEKRKHSESDMKLDSTPSTSSEGKAREGTPTVTIKTEDPENSAEVHIATSHMLWNVLSRIKMEPYQESGSSAVPEDSSSSYFSSQGKNNPPPSDIPKLVRDFMCRNDVSKVSTSSPNASSSGTAAVRYRMHYLPILHKQFEAENGNVCSYASFCSYVPENVIKPHGWQWKFCPCLPCINPELKYEKMISEGILKMDEVELGDILHDEAKENTLMSQLKELRDSRQFFTYDAWERNSSGIINAKRRTASEPITVVITKFIEELSMLKSHIQRSFYQYHAAKLARDRGLHCHDEVTLHIECSPLSVYRHSGSDSSSDPAAVFTFLTAYLWSQNFEQALAAVSENKDYSISGIWAGLEKILLSIITAGKRKINIISDCPTNKYRNKSNFYYMTDFARTYGVSLRWIFLELSHQIGNADIIRDEIERAIKDEVSTNPDMSLSKSDIQGVLQSRTSIIVDSYSQEDLQKYKSNLPKLRVVQGTQKFDEVIVLPEDFWVRDVIGFDTFKKLQI